MKKYILILGFSFLILNASAQLDTVKNAIQVMPVVYNQIEKDTLYQVHIQAFGLTIGDTTSGCNTYVTFYDRKAKRIGEKNIPIPASVVNKWGTDDAIIKEYVISLLNLVKK